MTTQVHRARTDQYYRDYGKPRFFFEGTKISNNYPKYDELKNTYTNHQSKPSPAKIIIDSRCPQSSGTAKVTIENTSGSNITATLHVAIAEKLSVNGRDTWTMRDMLAGGKGEEVTIAAGQKITKEWNFTLKSGWNKSNCKMNSFIQKSDKEIVQGCVSAIDGSSSLKDKVQRLSKNIDIKNSNKSVMVYLPENKLYSISLLDARGKMLKKVDNVTGKRWCHIDNSYSFGITLLKIDNDNVTFIKKVLIKN